MPGPNLLFYGDNLDVLREYGKDDSIDLIYLDPPFNSNATYNVLFKTHAGDESRAQIEAFDDTWHWGPQADEEYEALTKGRAPIEVARFIESMHSVLGTSDMMAYLVMMAPRLVEMRRVMKSTATIYLHCDPTASHYLKMLMDEVFGASHFQNEIVWYYKGAGVSPKRWGRRHDILLWYSKSDKWFFDPDPVRDPYAETTKERFSHYIGNVRGTTDYGTQELNPAGKHPDDVWQIPIIAPSARERLGYPTQKPLALLERVIASSCPKGGVILDPFCGCGTATDAAQQLERDWIGIDITYIAVDLIMKRLQHRYGDEILATFETNGIPKDMESADALFARNAFEFERWAVSFVNGQPNEKQVGDKGVDGRIRFDNGKEKAGTVVVSVKGGKQLNPAMVQSLAGAMHQEGAEMGLLITMGKPTRGMKEAASLGGTYEHPFTGNRYPVLQIITIPELFDGKRPNLPSVILPYFKAPRRPELENVSLFEEPDNA